jgi:hypothetical protein
MPNAHSVRAHLLHVRRKWDWAEARSPVVTPRHLVANSEGVMAPMIRGGGVAGGGVAPAGGPTTSAAGSSS